MGSRWFRRLAGLMVVPLLVAGLLVTAPHPAQAASGGRIGGGSFRSAPSMPRSYGGGGYGGGYRGGYGGGYRGGGIGFPFIVPIFGFGGGGLFGFLILMAVAGVVVNALRGGGGPSLGSSGSDLATRSRPDGPVTIAQIQVGLLATARDLQDDLRRLAGGADTSSSGGLQRVLQETSLSLLRHPDLWVYANGEVGQVPFASAESTFNRLSMQERSKLERELHRQRGRSPFQRAGDSGRRGQRRHQRLHRGDPAGGQPQPAGLKGARSAEDLRESLQKLGPGCGRSAGPGGDLAAGGGGRGAEHRAGDHRLSRSAAPLIPRRRRRCGAPCQAPCGPPDCGPATSSPMASRRISWVNTPVLLEAIERYEQGRLPRSLALWLQTVLEIEAPPLRSPAPGRLRRLPRQLQDPQGRHGGSVAVVDVHHGESGGAAGQHAHQGRVAPDAHPVTHGHRHPDHRLGQQAGHNGRQRPLHAGTGDQHLCPAQPFQLPQQTVQPGHPHIQHQVAGHPMAGQGQPGFRRHRQIAAAAAQDRHPAEGRVGRRRVGPGEAAGQGMVNG